MASDTSSTTQPAVAMTPVWTPGSVAASASTGDAAAATALMLPVESGVPERSRRPTVLRWVAE